MGEYGYKPARNFPTSSMVMKVVLSLTTPFIPPSQLQNSIEKTCSGVSAGV